MPDESFLDERYFVDSNVYNCPFCNRRHVSYSIYGRKSFDWTESKRCYVFFIRCHSCDGDSMHLTFQNLDTNHIGQVNSTTRSRFFFGEEVDEEVDEGQLLDKAFFYSVPTSFFVLDTRVPRVLRELLTEAESCLKSNLLTGSSACARKIVYELAVLEKATGDNYDDRIKSLKKIHPDVEAEYFDTLLTIQQLTSSKVHENSYDGWESNHLRIILASLREILHELYVVPALRSDRRKSILGLKEVLLSKMAKPAENDDDDDPP